ncbi:MAG: SMP-30/gluconolactonase/LRE family protein [Chitinophagaceae bacterium]|nr:SMP-30/gluconolactonase/LRE family protein [Chitinophagaceae bacterium]
MNKLVALIFVCLVASCANAPVSQDQQKTIDSSVIAGTGIEILDAEALNLIDTTAKIEKLGEGYEWSEGPLYIPDGDYLLFSDVPMNKVYKWKEGEGVKLYLDSSGYVGRDVPKKEPGSNGLLLDKNGNLVLCQHGLRRVARMDAPLSAPKAAYTSIVDNYKGKKLNSPNDAVFNSKGDLYFTDPPYGLVKGNDDSLKEQPHHGVYLVRENGKAELVTGELNYPNGIALTPDEKFLIVAHSDPDNMVWMKYELDAKGLIKNKSVFYKISEEEKKLPGSPDGFKINKSGYVFASAPGGVWVFNPSGKPIAKIYTGQATSNCAFSADQHAIYMTCEAFLYRLKLK